MSSIIVQTQPAGAFRAPGPYGWPEALSVAALLGVFFVLGRNGINHHAYIGQDFGFHYAATREALGNPDRWFFMDFTSRPLLYWLGGAGFVFARDHDGIRFAATVCHVFATLGLWIAYDSLRTAILSPVLRLATLAFISLLPVTVITSLVYAADTTAILPFALICWSTTKLLESDQRRFPWFPGLVLSLALTVAQFTKFTFILVPISVSIVLLLAGRYRMARWRVLLGGCACALLLPLVAGLWLHRMAHQQLADEPPRHTYVWQGTGEMTWRSLLWPKISDLRIYRAPAYADMEKDGERQFQPLLEHNGYSYPALLHLGLFTDVLGLSHRDSAAPDGSRPPGKQQAAAWSVRTGTAFSIAGVLSVLVFTVASLLGAIVRKAWLPAGAWVWGALGLAWFLPIMLLLPYVKFAYDWGYWLPRLILPSVWGFSVVLFATLDRLSVSLQHRPWINWTVLGLTLAQCALHVGALWTGGN